jgi:hypothetical protein
MTVVADSATIGGNAAASSLAKFNLVPAAAVEAGEWRAFGSSFSKLSVGVSTALLSAEIADGLQSGDGAAVGHGVSGFFVMGVAWRYAAPEIGLAYTALDFAAQKVDYTGRDGVTVSGWRAVGSYGRDYSRSCPACAGLAAPLLMNLPDDL